MSAYYFSLRYGARALLTNNANKPNRMNISEALNNLDATTTATPAVSGGDYSALKPADALAHLRETLAGECDRFTRDTGLKVAAIKVKTNKESDDYLLEVHAR